MSRRVDFVTLLRFFRIAQTIVVALQKRVSLSRKDLARDVAQRLNTRELPPESAKDVSHEILAAIHVLHEAGVIEERAKPTKYVLTRTTEPLNAIFSADGDLVS